MAGAGSLAGPCRTRAKTPASAYPLPHDLLMEYGESCLIVKQCEDMESLDLLTTEQKAWGGQCLMVKKLIERIAELEYKSNNEGLD